MIQMNGLISCEWTRNVLNSFYITETNIKAYTHNESMLRYQQEGAVLAFFKNLYYLGMTELWLYLILYEKLDERILNLF